MNGKLLKVIIPIYKPQLKDYERAALENNLRLLEGFPVTFLKPEHTDMTELHEQYPAVGMQSVSDEWLGTKKGIQGYNEMMMSEKFYELFSDYEYILICHVDAWLFRNELVEWCRKGYDHVAAPWPMRPRYRRFPLKQYLKLKLWLKPKRKIIHCQMFGKIGNGGLSLRRVETFRKACVDYADTIAYYNSQSGALYNEDLFWALEPSLKLPSVEEALKFSFDLKPELSYELNHQQLPMACHGFNKPVRIKFWRQFIHGL